MKPYLNNSMYTHFLTFHCAIRILSTKQLCHKYNEYANDLLIFFVENFSDIYGAEFVNHNAHNLIHLAADVKIHGPLDNFSCFKFENYMSTIKRSIKSGKHPLVQFVKRSQEYMKFSTNQTFLTEFELLKEDGWKQINNKLVMTYSGIKLVISEIRTKEPDCYILLKGNIAGKVISVFIEDGEKYFQMQQFQNFLPLFQLPCSSKLLGCGRVEHLEPHFTVAPVSHVVCKGLKFENFFLSLCHLN